MGYRERLRSERSFRAARGALLLLVVVAARPLGIAASNLAGVGHGERLILLVLAIWLLSLCGWWVLVKIGMRTAVARNLVFVVLGLLIYAGGLIHEFGRITGPLLIVTVGGFAAYVLQRIGPNRIISAIVWGTGIALLSGPPILAYSSWHSWGEDFVVKASTPSIQMTERPDIFLVVLDGYPGLVADEMDDVSASPSMIDLRSAPSIQIPESAWSAYWSTERSVSSLLDMSYPTVDGESTEATTSSLFEIIGGANSLVEILNANGYETIMIEAGWSGSVCGSGYDRCVAASLLDEAMFNVLYHTVSGPFILDQMGYAFTAGSQRTMAWLLENSQELSTSPEPQFVFAHVLAPHPPFFLDEHCELVVDATRTGSQFYFPGVSPEEREDQYLGQRSCVDDFMRRLVRQVVDDDIVVLVGDHGTDRRSQTVRHGSEWSDEAETERLNVFLAVRITNTCRIQDPIISPNLMREVLSCLSSKKLPLMNPRMWKESMIELDPGEVATLMARLHGGLDQAGR